MPIALTLLGPQLKEIWRHLGVNQKVSIVFALLLTVVVIGGLFYWSSRPDYRLLYTGVSLKDAAAMQEKLADAKIPVQLKDSGRAIYVPSKDVYRGRVLLAAVGLPKESSIGFEIFEQPKFGLTDFAQQVNYQRALQGEIERTIMAINGVESARVMLVIPKEHLFSTAPKNRTTASILVTVGANAVLAPSHIQSIVQFVSTAVPGLLPTDVTVTDQNGKLLTKATAGSEDLEEADEQLGAQEKVCAGLAKKAQDVLDTALGVGKSIVRVSAVMDFSKREKRKESYDSQNKVVKSEMIESENTTTPGPQVGNVVGVVANIPVGNPEAGTVDKNANMSKSKKENIRTEYAIPSEVEQTVIKGGQITSLSVSVCLAKGTTARTEEELKKIEKIIQNTVGFTANATRQDTISVLEIDFPAAPAPAAQPASWQRMLPDLQVVKTGAMWGIALILAFLVWRRVTRAMEVKQEDVGTFLPSAASGRASGEYAVRGEINAPLQDIGELNAVAEQNPKAIAAWIKSVSTPGT